MTASSESIEVGSWHLDDNSLWMQLRQDVADVE